MFSVITASITEPFILLEHYIQSECSFILSNFVYFVVLSSGLLSYTKNLTERVKNLS